MINVHSGQPVLLDVLLLCIKGICSIKNKKPRLLFGCSPALYQPKVCGSEVQHSDGFGGEGTINSCIAIISPARRWQEVISTISLAVCSRVSKGDLFPGNVVICSASEIGRFVYR